MKKKLFKKYYQNKGHSNSEIKKAISDVTKLENQLNKEGKNLHTANISDIKKYVQTLINYKENKETTLLALARYFYLIDAEDIYIYFTSIFGSKGVMENIKIRATRIVGEDMTEEIFNNLSIPPLGTSNKKLFNYTKKVMGKMEENLEPEVCRKILTGNNHNIPKESFLKEKEFYKKAENLDDYLKNRHMRKVKELQQHSDQDKIWFEQKINQDVVDYVDSNQEILSAVREKDKLYTTKIPYDIVNFLDANNKKMKQYFTCHCPFVRESFLSGEQINADWCYCSAGFVKFPYEIVFDTALDIELLESPLKGDPHCRFVIYLSEHLK